MKKIIALSVLTLGLVGGVAAQSMKIGFVSTDRIFKEAPAAKAAQSKLEQEFAKREKDIQQMAEQLQGSSAQLERDAPTLSEAQKSSRQRQLVDMDREFQRKRREFQEDLNLRKNEELQVVLERANRIIKQVAEADKFDLILQDVVYINPKHDITDKIISRLTAQ